MALPIEFSATTLMTPAISAVAGGVGTMFTSNSNSYLTMFGVDIPAPVYTAVAVGVSTMLVLANSTYLLPWLGVTDPTTYNAIYFATPFLTGLSVVAIDSLVTYLGSGSISGSSQMLSMFMVGALAAVVGQYASGGTNFLSGKG